MFRTREIAGWLLVLFSLYLIRLALDFVNTRQVVEASVVVFAAIGVFRGGIHLIKVATAARICLAVDQTRDNSEIAQMPDRAPRQ